LRRALSGSNGTPAGSAMTATTPLPPSPQDAAPWRLLTLCCLITFGSYLATSMRLPVVPLYARTVGVDTAQIGVINAAFFLMAGLLSFPAGGLADRWGGKPVAAAGLTLLALAALGLCFCRSFGGFVAVYMLFGVGTAAFGPTMMAMVAVIAPRTHLGRAYGWYTTALFCGMSLGPALAGLLAQGARFRSVFAAAGGISLLVLGLLAMVLPPQAFPRAAARAPGRGRANLKAVLRNGPLVGCWVVTLGACFGLGMFTSFVPLHARDQGLTVSQIGLVFLVQGLCNGLSRIPFGRLSDYVPRRAVLVTIGMLGYTAALSALGMAHHHTTFLVLGALTGIGMGLAFTSVGALIAETVSADARGLAMGGYNTCIYVGMMASSAAMGAIIPHIGFAAAFCLTAAVCLATLLVFIRLIKNFDPRCVSPGD